MSFCLANLGLAINSRLAVPDAPNYRPPCWPPPPDWPVVIDADRQVVSRWSDPVWRLDPWAGKSLTLNFGDGTKNHHAAAINPDNAQLLRIVTGWWLYGSNGVRGYRTLKTRFDQMRRLFVLCAQEGVLASELSHFPRVVDRLPDVLQRSRARELLMLLYELHERREALGFTLLNRRALARLEASLPRHETRQTPYIPPRIWRYQVTRLRECLDDFLAHRAQIEACFRFCLSAYRHNLETLGKNDRKSAASPFQWPADGSGESSGRCFYGPFFNTATRFGLTDLLERWVGWKGRPFGIAALSSYLTLVSRAGLAYLLNFSLMRVEECWNLRTNCLRIEQDPRFGDIYLLQGQTTKTYADADTFWVTSPSAAVAIDAMTLIAELRADCIPLNLSDASPNDDSVNRHLVNYAYEPWAAVRQSLNPSLRPSIVSYEAAFGPTSKMFDPEQLRITRHDLDLARLVTPTLSDEFAVGETWPLAWHQLRRTGAVNMQASGLVGDASLQFQLKHVTRAMSLYYGQNHSHVRLEEKAHTLYVRTLYETLGRELQQLATDRFFSPHGEKRKAEIVRLITASDAKQMAALAKKGTVACRPILLGMCTSREPCPYGGIDNIAHCGGGDALGDAKPCPEVLYDQNRRELVESLEREIEARLATAEADSPLRASLAAQKRSAENYRNALDPAKLD